MCAHFIMIPREELERIIADIKNGIAAGGYTDTMTSRQDAFPRAVTPVVTAEDNGLSIQSMSWGYPVSWQKEVLFNTKIETALGAKDNMWRDSVLNRRCVIPSYGFFEPHRQDTHISTRTGKPVKDQYSFRLPDTDIVWMAGIFEDGHYSIMTTAPNTWVKEIHPRMPIVLRQNELDIWLDGTYTALADRQSVQLESHRLAS